jgi:Skp family chaperone for outer membrane proteins
MGRGLRQALLALWAGLSPALCAMPALAQEGQPGPVFKSQLAVVQQDQLFARTLYGKAVQARIEAARQSLLSENQRIEAGLEAEERALTQRRPTMTPAEFRKLADAFDAKVEGIRSAQEAKGRAVARQAEEDRQRFFQTAYPVLARLMAEIGAVALMDKSDIIISLEAIDVTDRAVARIDSTLGDGSASEAPAEAPEPSDAGQPEQ